MALDRIEQPLSYRQKVYIRLKDAIISQQLPPGQPLQERQLAEELGVSRTPIREALALLANEGWVKNEPWKGTIVQDISAQDMEEVFQLRLALEPLVVELIMNNLTKTDFNKLENYLQQQEEILEGERQVFIDIDRDFHSFMARKSGNRRLIDILDNLSDMMRRLGVQAVKKPGRTRETLEEHQALLAALKRKDVEGAKAAMVSHLERTKRTVLSFLENEERMGGKSQGHGGQE